MRRLPEDFGKLTTLQELHLARCESLQALPVSLEELSSLRLLDLSRSRRIKDLPDGLGKLTSLVKLLLCDCKSLNSIPESIGRLTSLDSIDLSMTDLKELPDRFCDLSSITRLAMDGCMYLERLPDRFGAVTSLRRLSLCDCRSLKKLPESFSQLKYLEYLNLSLCKNLEELCEHFKGLSSLRVLLLSRCEKLKKLPQDFNGLPSLDTLDLTYCYMLEGKSMEGIVKLKKLQTLLIRGSWPLLEKWGEIQKQCDQSWSFAVETGETGEGSLQARDDFSLTDGKGKAFNISDLPLNTDLLVLFDCQQEFRHCSTLIIIEENMDDNLEIIYFGNHFSKLPHKVAGGIRGHAPAKLFGQLFPLLAYQQEEKFELSAIRAKIVPGEKGEKTLSCGKILENKWNVEEFVVEKCGRYLKFKQLVKTAGDSNIELLRELFPNGEFLKNGASTKVGVEELKGKRILLDMRPANLCYDIPLQSLVDLYNVAEKERFDFEIITIPMMQENTRRDVSNSFSTEVPWLVLQNPWDLPNATKYFLIEGSQRWDRFSWEARYPSKMRVIESNGTIAAYNSPGILWMVNTWGTEAFPFTEEKRRELIDKEVKQMKEMSNLMFLFQHLQGRVSEQVEKAMRQQKMFCLCIGDCTTSMKSMLGEWNDNIYTIYIPPNFHALDRGRETVYFTHGRSEVYTPLQHPTAVTQVEMEGMCSLSLSEHEAIRFWARFHSLLGTRIFDDLGKLPDFTWRRFVPFMIIMDEDGNLITTQGEKIIKLLSEEHSHDKAKGLVQQLINGDKESRKETLIELEELM